MLWTREDYDQPFGTDWNVSIAASSGFRMS